MQRALQEHSGQTGRPVQRVLTIRLCRFPARSNDFTSGRRNELDPAMPAAAAVRRAATGSRDVACAVLAVDRIRELDEHLCHRSPVFDVQRLRHWGAMTSLCFPGSYGFRISRWTARASTVLGVNSSGKYSL